MKTQSPKLITPGPARTRLPTARLWKKPSDLYSGDLLPSCYEDWIQAERERLKGSYFSLLEELVEILEAEGELEAAILQSQNLIRQDPLLETSYQRLMSLYLSSGDRAKAVRTYHQLVEILEKEMGLDPSPETQELYQGIMERDLPLQVTPRVTEKRSRLVGREEAWNRLHQTWLDHQTGGHLVVILGEAGIGKSYLAEEFLRWARKGGVTCLKTRSYPTEDELAYTPVTSLLRDEVIQKKLSGLDPTWLIELARLLPELREKFPNLPDPEPLSDGWKRQRMFEATSQLLLGDEKRIVVVLDDLQWCDLETLDWLRFTLEYKSNSKLLVIAGVRSEDLQPESPLIPLFADLERSNKITEILLDRLDLEATGALASALWGEPVEGRAAKRLFEETEGNPLFVAEMVRGGYLKDLGDGSDLSRMPPKVQIVIETRLNALPPKTRELACLAAVIGRGFNFELLFRAGEGKEDELLQALDELWSKRLIRDEGSEGYNFSHDKFREVLYEKLSPHRQVHYHKKVARALEEIHADRLESVAPQLAYQYDRAGNQDRALEYYLLAGDQARLVFAQGDALTYYQSAEKIGWKEKDSRPVALYSGMGRTLLSLARYDESVAAYLKMSQAAHSMRDPESEAQAWLAVATVHDRLGKFKEALESTAKAEEIAKKYNCPKEQANALLMKGQQFYRLGDVEKAEPLLRQALAIHQQKGDQPGVGRCLNLLGLIADVRGDFASALQHKNEAISIFQEINDTLAQWWIGKITCNLANTASHRGEYLKAVNLYQQLFGDHGGIRRPRLENHLPL